jgi:hypothetical protein
MGFEGGAKMTPIDSQLLQQQGYADAQSGRVSSDRIFDGTFARECYLQGFRAGCQALKFQQKRENQKKPIQTDIFKEGRG